MALLNAVVELADGITPSGDVLEATGRCFVDAVGTVVLGLRAPVTAAIQRGLSFAAPERGVTALTCQAPVEATQAVLLHGTAAHVFDIGDGLADSGLHPGEVLAPVALAIAEREGSSGPQLCRSLAGGYEVMGRIGRALHPELTDLGMCPSGPVGAMAAAYVAADLMGLSAKQKAEAIGTALLVAPVSTFAWGRSRPVHAGAAASSGVLAADLSRVGIEGDVGALDGPRGLGTAAGVAPDELYERALAELAPAILRAYFKPHAACRHSHGAIDAALHVRPDLPGTAEKVVEKVTVITYPLAVRLVDRATTVDSDWATCDTSIQYATAAALMTGRCGPDEMSRRGRKQGAIHKLAARITVESSVALGAIYPDEAPTCIAMALRDGSSRSAEVRSRWGDPERPLSTSEVCTRFTEWAVRAGIDAQDASNLVSITLSVGRGERAPQELLTALRSSMGSLPEDESSENLEYP